MPIGGLGRVHTYVTLHNYQNAFMYKSKPKVNPTLIICANKVYELRMGTIRTHRSTGSLKIQL